MSAIRSKDTSPEMAVRTRLHRQGYRYRVHDTGLPGKPDIVFPRERIAVFIDGDFWHGRVLMEDGLAALKRRIRRNHDYWIPKITRTVERDRNYAAKLREEGWRVFRYWESDVRLNVDRVVLEIAWAVDAARKSC